MNIESAQLTLSEAQKQRGHWENVVEQIWRDAAKAEIVFLLKKGKMHQTACKIVSVGWFDRVEIRRLDNGKTYSIHPSFLKWPKPCLMRGRPAPVEDRTGDVRDG